MFRNMLIPFLEQLKKNVIKMKNKQELFEEISTSLIPDVFYDIPIIKVPEIAFRYIGTAGENTKFQFVAEPGGWKVTLSPEQLMGEISFARKREMLKVIHNAGI